MLGSENRGFARFTLYQAKLAHITARQKPSLEEFVIVRHPRDTDSLYPENPKPARTAKKIFSKFFLRRIPFFSVKSSRPPGPPRISRARARFLRTRMKNKAPLRPPARGPLDEHSFVAPRVLFSCSPAEQDLGLARTRQVQEPCSSPGR